MEKMMIPYQKYEAPVVRHHAPYVKEEQSHGEFKERGLVDHGRKEHAYTLERSFGVACEIRVQINGLTFSVMKFVILVHKMTM